MSGASSSRRRPSVVNTRACEGNTNDKGGPNVERQYVGIDLHRRRSVIVRMTPEGEKLDVVRIENDPVAMALELAKAGPNPEVILEATYGWYWASDLLQANGATVHLAHPLGNNWGHRRVKNDLLTELPEVAAQLTA